MYIGICGCHMRKSGAARRAHGQRPRSTHDRIARHTKRRPSTGKAAHGPADDVVEELELRQGVLEVFRSSKKRDHGDLRAAQKRVRQRALLGSRGLRMREAGWKRGEGRQAHLFDIVPAAPAPRTGGGDRPPLRVQRRVSLSSGSVGHAGATAGAYQAAGSIALRSRSRPKASSDPQRPIPFQEVRDA